MKNEEQEISKTNSEESFVIYDPDNLPYERLHLCKYLLELPDLEEGRQTLKNGLNTLANDGNQQIFLDRNFSFQYI